MGRSLRSLTMDECSLRLDLSLGWGGQPASRTRGKAESKMRKVQILGAVFFAALALSAVVASAAFAEDQWLINGLAVSEAKSVVAEGKGLNRLLPIIGSNIHLVCDFKVIGTVGPKGLGTVTNVTDLSGKTPINCELLHSELGLCTGSLLDLTKAINLPWHTQLLLLTDQTLFVDDVLLETGKTPGYEVSCTGAFGETIKETCEGGGTTDDLTNLTGGVMGSVLNQLSDKCGISGNVSHVEGQGETKALVGTLSVSHN
jgi:hypothetical protein